MTTDEIDTPHLYLVRDGSPDHQPVEAALADRLIAMRDRLLEDADRLDAEAALAHRAGGISLLTALLRHCADNARTMAVALAEATLAAEG